MLENIRISLYVVSSYIKLIIYLFLQVLTIIGEGAFNVVVEHTRSYKSIGLKYQSMDSVLTLRKKRT